MVVLQQQLRGRHGVEADARAEVDQQRVAVSVLLQAARREERGQAAQVLHSEHTADSVRHSEHRIQRETG